MPTSHTPVTIANRALDMVSEFPISSLTDQSTYARWINRNLTHTVEVALRQNPWNFATELYQLNEAADAPAYRWRYAYDLPNGWLRVLPPTYDGYRDGPLLAYEVKRNRLLMNDRGPRPVEVVLNVQNPGEWDPLFAELIAARLATGLAHRFTAKNSFVEQCRQLAQEAFESAELINAFEGSAMPVEQHDILRVRGGNDWERWR